jgi:hypothetical protein
MRHVNVRGYKCVDSPALKLLGLKLADTGNQTQMIVLTAPAITSRPPAADVTMGIGIGIGR